MKGCLSTGLIQKEEDVVHHWQHRVEYGYPIPNHERDHTLVHLLKALESVNIFSRGRFGACARSHRAAFGDGTMTSTRRLSERERINTDVQEQMEIVTDKWGIRISRIEIVRHPAAARDPRRARPAEAGRSGEAGADPPSPKVSRRTTINIAEGPAEGAERAAEGGAKRRSCVPKAPAIRVLEAEGRAQAIETVYGAIRKENPIRRSWRSCSSTR